ncbi:hypothetical protein C8D87_11425 [Lentzea atacamensis]|uniref:Sporulation protein n=1 Tax=Lentzea atacamensis TaxID=531938 RepID=A0ABX9DXH1_9PSEU|nr:sporulation protein [Lentzea atacamensis]RAS59413.1 hypothetical protein C8D87_11425 [Lentzea atacamensis]
MSATKPSKPANPDLERVVATTEASRASLAHRLNELATTAGLHTRYTHTSWANWITRGHNPQPEIRPLIAQVLAERLGRPVTLREIGLEADDSPESSIGLDFPRELPVAVQVATRLWSRVDRRTFLTGSAMAVGAYIVPLRRWLTLPADPRANSCSPEAFRRVGHSDVDELVAAAEDARRWDSRYGGGHWRTSAITACLKERAAPLLHGSYDDATGRRLFSATAQLARLAGWTAFDNGDQALAQRHYIQALRLARAAGDLPLGGYVVSCMALQASLRGFHSDAADMVDAAYHRTQHHASRRVRAFHKLIEARVWARAGNSRAAAAALSRSELLLDTAEHHTGDDPAWIDFFDHNRLAADAVEIHRDLGKPIEALTWNSLANAPIDAFGRSHALREAVIATCHLQGRNPDLDRALHHTHHVVTALTCIRSARTREYLDQVRLRLARWKYEPAVRHLEHRVRTELAA